MAYEAPTITEVGQFADITLHGNDKGKGNGDWGLSGHQGGSNGGPGGHKNWPWN